VELNEIYKNNKPKSNNDDKNETSGNALWKEILEAFVALANDSTKAVGSEEEKEEVKEAEDDEGEAGSKGSKSKDDKNKKISALGKFMKARKIRKGGNTNQQVSNTAV